MNNILHIDSSPRRDRSVSRQLTQGFLDGWRTAHPEDRIIHRDLAANPPPHVDLGWILGAYELPGADGPDAVHAMKISDALFEEFVAADRYVFSVPMYNFNVPSTFKAYVDQIIRPKKAYTPEWKGLIQGKKMLIITSRGGAYLPGTPMAAYDQQEPFLRTAFGFIGITDITFVHAQSINIGQRDAAMEECRATLQKLVTNW